MFQAVELMQRYSKLADVSRICRSSRVRRVPVARPRIHDVRKRLGPGAVDQLLGDYRDGAPATALMSKYGIGKGAVLRILDESGVTRRQHRPTIEQLTKAAELYAQGWSLVRLGEHFGFDQGTIWKGLSQLGVEMRRPWERRHQEP